MSIATLFLTSTLLFGNGINLPTDTLKIEQKAFDYFVSNIDSVFYIGFSEPRPFDITSDTIYYSGNSTGKGIIQFASAKYFKGDFFVVDSLYYQDDKPDFIKSLTSIKEPITCISSYVQKCDYNWFQSQKVTGNIYVWVANKFFHRGYYYVRISIRIGVDHMSNEVYLRFNELGNFIDWRFRHGIE